MTTLIFGTAFLSQQTVEFVILGLATGALYAMVALGVVVTYRASGVLNFAAGATGAFAAFVFYSLRDERGVTWIVAFVIALAVAATLGALTHLIVMRALAAKLSLLAKLIATLGVMTVLQGAISVIWPDLQQGSPTSILPTTLVKIASHISIPEERLILIGIALVCAVLLWAVYAKTLWGLATSAVAESPSVAAGYGWSPSLIELGNFVLSGVLSAIAAIFLAPIIGLDGSVLTLTIIPALAAGLVGRFSSFVVTVAAALGIGIIGTELSLFQPDIANFFGWQPTALTGLTDVVPLLIIIVAVTLAGKARLQRGETLTRLPLPGSGRISPALLLTGAAVGAVALLALPSSWVDPSILTIAWAILILSVVVLTGYCGQLSLCQYALAGFGAWVAARLMTTQGFSFGTAALIGAIATVPLGLVVAIPALRTRGVNLAVATLGFAIMLYALIFNNGALTGGFEGTQVKSPHLFGINLDPVEFPRRFGIFALVLLVLSGVAVANIRRGAAGRRMLAVRANERAAASLGIGVYGAKLYAFAVSAFIAAIAGIVLAFHNTNVQFVQFDVFGSINTVLYAVVGGIGWASGSIIGALQAPDALASKVLTELITGNVTAWLVIVSGVAVILTLKLAPDGLAEVQSAQWQMLLRALRRRGVRRSSTPAVAAARVRDPAELRVSGITVKFGAVEALADVGLAVRPGEIVGLIGPNGAGKTTLLDVVTGFTRASSGSVLLNSQAVDGRSPERRARMGIGRSWQAVELFEEMTVRENLWVAADLQSRSRYAIDLVWPGKPRVTEMMTEIVEEFGLERYLDDRPSKLPQGLSRLVGIGRVMVSEPRILLLDEPAAGLDSQESSELGLAIRRLVSRTGIGVLLVEHDVQLLMSICDRIVVLDFGRKIAEGTPEEVASDPVVMAAYLGVAPPVAEPSVERSRSSQRSTRSLG